MDTAANRAGNRRRAPLLLADREEAAEVSLKVRLLMDCRTAFAGAPALPSAVLLAPAADEEASCADLSEVEGREDLVEKPAHNAGKADAAILPFLTWSMPSWSHG